MTDKIIPSTGYNHLEPGSPGNTKMYAVCGAHTRNELTVNELCQRPAGWGTSHSGVGRCKLHGGSIGTKPNRYSSLWRGRMAEIAKLTMEQDDSDPLDLLSELDVQRVLLSVMIDRLNGIKPGEASYQDDTRAMAAVREYINRPPAMSRSMKRRMLESDKQVDAVGGGGVVNNDDGMEPVDNTRAEFVSSDTESDSPESQKPNIELVEQIRQQINDIVTTVTRIVAQRNSTAITKAELTYLLLIMKEGMDRFVPRENQESFVRYLMEKIPGGKGMGVDTEFVEG